MPGPTQPADASAPELKAVGFTIQSEFPFDVTLFVPCGNGGAGQDVTFSGTIHDVFHVTETPSGHLTVKVLDNPQGVTGVGQVTGTIYHGTEMTQFTETTRYGKPSPSSTASTWWPRGRATPSWPIRPSHHDQRERHPDLGG